jgi:hypothetical protein
MKPDASWCGFGISGGAKFVRVGLGRVEWDTSYVSFWFSMSFGPFPRVRIRSLCLLFCFSPFVWSHG